MKKNVTVLTCSIVSLMLSQLPVYAAEAQENQETKKDETVYAMLEADGTVYDEIISSWLHNDAGLHNITEQLQLQHVENVKGDEQPVIDGSTYTWNVEGSDVYYQGTSTKQLPIEVSITYRLNGKELTPDELAGKSGHLEISISMKNTSSKTKVIQGVETTLHPLYLAAGVIDFNSDHFTNVTCDDAKVLSDGNNQVVGFYTLPGFEDTLQSAGIKQAHELPIKDTYVINTDVTDFEMGPIMIAITPELPLDQLKEMNSLDDLTNGVDELNNAGAKLLEGSEQLSNASGQFADKMSELDTSITPLSEGITTVQDAVTKLSQGSGILTTNLITLEDGSAKLQAGAKELYSGTASLPELIKGISDLKDGAAKLNSGIGQLKDGIDQMNASAVTNGQLEQLKTALSTIKNDQGLLDSLQPMLTSLQALNTSFNVANQNPSDPANPLPSLKDLSNATATSSLESAQQMHRFCTTTFQDQTSSEFTDCMAIAQTAAASATNAGAIQAIIATPDKGIADQVQGMNSALSSIDEAQLTALTTMMKELDSAIQGIDQLESGIVALEEHMDALMTGSQALQDGSQTLYEASSSMNELGTGIKQLYDASTTLHDGSSQLVQGSSTLQDGLTTLNDGTTTLANQTPFLLDGIHQLNSASQTLSSKTTELHNGIYEFKATGLDQLSSEVSMSMADLNKIIAIKDELIKENETAHSFSGAPENAETKVKFIYKTKEIKQKPIETQPEQEQETNAHQGIWEKIMNFFTNLL